MFKIRYDMTEGRLRKIGSRRAGSYRRHSTSTNATMRYGATRRTATTSTNITSPALAGGGMSQRYSPVFERAEDPTLAEDFLPADPQTQHKIFRNLIMFDPIAGPAVEYWRDLAFSQNVILSGISDERVLNFYQDAIYASGILPMMPMLLSDFLAFGKFVFHMLYDESRGYWTETIPHDLDYISISVSPIPSLDPLIDLQPTQEAQAWATSPDPRVIEQRHGMDQHLVSMMAAGQPIPLAPENTMFLPRKVFATDYYGTSFLTRIMPFKIYEKALLDASIAGARRRAGPLWHITVWPDASDDEISEVLDLFFAAEEDPIGGKVVTRDGVLVTPVGGGSSDFWKLSDEWAFLSEAKMRALGISETFLSGEANWNSMEMILSTFLEKVRAVRAYFTQKILLEKMITGLAKQHGFVKRTPAELSHRIRTGAKSRRFRNKTEPEYHIPTIEWDKPLSPIADREYLDILSSLEEAGLPIPIRMKAQVAGFDIDKALESFDSDIETHKKIYEQQVALGELRKSYGIDESGQYTGEGTGEGIEEDGLDFGDLGESGDDFGDEAPLGDAGEDTGLEGLDESPEEPAGGDDTGPPPAAPASPGAGEGFGADTEKRRFKYNRPPQRKVTGSAQETATVRDLLEELEALPLWDATGAVLGMPMRKVAKILDRIDQTSPDKRKRLKLGRSLLRNLRRKEGLDRGQATFIQYMAMRLSLVPPIEMAHESYEMLSKFIVGKMGGNGLSRAITKEIVALSQLAEAAGHSRPANKSRLVEAMPMIPMQERYLRDDQLLTGVVNPNPSPFTKG